MAKKRMIKQSRHGGLPLCAILLVSLLFQVQDIAAQEQAPQNKTAEMVALLPSTQEALLLFWEEKELYVSTATRISKPLSQTAENIVVITAKDIEDMNAHTLAEVLNTVPGVHVDPQGQDFGSAALLHIHGSEIRHVTVLIDGFSMNTLSDGNASIWLIPPKIIDRIEIIKGPASSAWGSSLGGVINVITKNTGFAVKPQGTLSASYGEADSQDHSAELSGKGGPVGYYVFAGRQYSKGIRYEGFNMDSFYGKINYRVTPDFDIIITAGYTDPEINSGSLPAANMITSSNTRGSFATASLDYRITEELSVKGGLHLFDQAIRIPTRRFTTGAFLRETRCDETQWGANMRLVYQGEKNSAVAGFEFGQGNLHNVIVQAASPIDESPEIEKWAFFLNDTVTLGKFSLTPGIRLDHNDISGSFISPSIGATYSPFEHTVFRASVARGFTTPPLTYMVGGARNIDPNPDLNEEKVWSYQVGAETGVLDYLLARVNFFRHDSKDSLVRVTSTTPRGSMYENNGDTRRQGVELGLESAPVYNISLKAGYSYVHVKADQIPSGQDKNSWVNYSYNMGIKYDDRTQMAQLTGTYVWWDLPASQGAKYDDFIWDLNASRKVFSSGSISGEVFGTVHNLFNSSYYNFFVFPNPHRWVEGGVRLKF